ncbi:hypothetical protein DFH08DRAFT_947511 [Mycena albidolilacea]|uniref:Transmembrane protein n=1 Tax=Mycena albidolilacea TaxID=1033008 RepID=A0AAD7AVM7_9AGAR|nr:hypothetical protein DFH08DRAFT_947511 [Mycena albidolilacea]
MHLPLAFLLYLLPLLSAAPAPSLSSVPPSTVAAASTSASETSDGANTAHADSVTPSSASNSRQSTSQTPTTTHKPTAATSKHHVATKTVQATGGQIPVHSTTHIVVPGPAPSHFHPKSQHHQSEATLVFEILGALAGVVFILSVIRCIYSYNRTPSRDRITAILHRHQLQREMEELERHPPDRRHSLVEPPPPYVAPPPSYPDDESTLLTNRGSASYGEDPRTPSSFRPNG